MNLISLLSNDPKSPLLFNSGTFLVLFTGFILVHALLRGRNRVRLAWILAFSLYYYYRSNGVYTLTLVALATVDFWIALRLHAEPRPRLRKAWLITSITLNLLGLGFFKYTNFLLNNLAYAMGKSYDPLDIFLPLGISFHVFQSISYLVDVYRRRLAPTRSLFEYIAFLCFFPQLVAGPIVRAEEFFSQVRPLAEPTKDDLAEGLFRVIVGLLKKAVFADFLGRFADLVFATPAAYSGPEVLLGIYAYSVQIYFDFSGYSDMALGMARLVGIKIPENFLSPYRATSITDFWRRWHVSLSSWLREYLYIPLGGNRQGCVRQMVNLMVTMLLGGLWHGASWNFVIWGGLHGALLGAERAARGRGVPPAQASRGRRIASWFVTIHAVAALWVVFRAKSFGAATAMFLHLSDGWAPSHVASLMRARHELVLALLVGFVISVLPDSEWRRLGDRFRPLPTLAKAGAFLAVLEVVVQLSTKDIQPFIYFQF